MIFEGNVPQKDTLARSYGTFILCKGVYNARRIVKHRWDKKKSTLTVFIDLRREKVRLKRPAQFSFSIQLNDSQPCKYKMGTMGFLGYTTQCPYKSNQPSYCCKSTTCKPADKFSLICSGVCKTTQNCPIPRPK